MIGARRREREYEHESDISRPGAEESPPYNDSIPARYPQGAGAQQPMPTRRPGLPA